VAGGQHGPVVVAQELTCLVKIHEGNDTV
jgi:hypothetical protein